eukprot:gene401-433_t
MSARERRPQTGRSNLGDVRNDDFSRSKGDSMSQTNQSSAIPTVTSSMKARFNDTLTVSRAFSPRDPFAKPVKIHPPIFPTSRFPTIPPYDESEKPKLRRPLTCPHHWITEGQKPHAFDVSALTGDLPAEEKQKHCREFIERNRSKLWQYDREYTKKTPRTLCNEITEDFNYLAIMTKNYKREKNLALSNSNSIREILQHTDDGSFDRRIEDPFMVSMTTTRSARQRNVETLIQPILREDDGKFRRGYNHAPEYGNFSKFNSVLKVNQGSVLKR